MWSAAGALIAALTFTAPLAASAAETSAESSHELAVWVPLQLTFPYRQLTTQYSCSGLELRMKRLLLRLGARSDLEVRGYGCTQLIEQVAQKILPLLTVRNVDSHATCQARNLLPGAVRLKADVLVADQGAAAAGPGPASASWQP